MPITLLGTCRINGISGNNNLNNQLNYTHTTKEAIQLIRLLKGEITLPEPYDKICLRTGIVENRSINITDDQKSSFNDSEVFVVEISSSKKYIHGGFYLHHLAVDKRFSEYNDRTPEHIINETVVEKQTDEEIESDILEITDLLTKQKVLFVSHYNSLMDGSLIPQRNELISLLSNICKKHGLNFVNPTELLSDYDQSEVMTDDLGHYTDFGLDTISKLLTEIVEKMSE